jgi:small conductance mechanosensitive channel
MNTLLFDSERMAELALIAIPHIVAAAGILLAFWLFLRITRPVLRRGLVRAQFAGALIRLLVDGVFKGAVVMVAFVMAASQLGINVAAALAGLGVAGIAVGFAAQETIANMIAGFLVFWDRPFRVGDFITTHDTYGQVYEITMRTTRIRTQENTFVVIPNKNLIGELLVNHSMYGELRVNVPIGIAYKEKIAEARRVLLPILARIDGVLSRPAPDVVALELGNSSVNLHARVWIADASIERPISFAVLEACKVALDDAGIEIPFPHLQLYLEDVRGPVWEGLARLPGLSARTS